MLKAVLSAVTAIALAVKAWAKARLWKTEKEKKRREELDKAVVDYEVADRELDAALADKTGNRIGDVPDLIRKHNEAKAALDAAALKMSGVVAVVAAALLLGSGCASWRGGGAKAAAKEQPLSAPKVLVIGARVQTVEPGATVVVPDLTPPASVWYLVDNIGVAQWLGLKIAYPTGGAQEGAKK